MTEKEQLERFMFFTRDVARELGVKYVLVGICDSEEKSLFVSRGINISLSLVSHFLSQLKMAGEEIEKEKETRKIASEIAKRMAGKTWKEKFFAFFS